MQPGIQASERLRNQTPPVVLVAGAQAALLPSEARALSSLIFHGDRKPLVPDTGV